MPVYRPESTGLVLFVFEDWDKIEEEEGDGGFEAELQEKTEDVKILMELTELFKT
jgi:hypothetical protein